MANNDDILNEARERFKYCQDWESITRNNFRFDRRFDAGDSINLYQWPAELYRPRMDDGKPCLTVNKAHQHVLQITNDAKQNKPSVTIRPVGNGATYKAAEILEGIVRHIEYQSNAVDAYDTATTHQCVGGIGWWRVTTDYSNDDSFDQEIYIRRVADPLSVYLDPDIKELDGSDANYGFIFVDIPESQWIKDHPRFKDAIPSTSPLGEDQNDDHNWLSESHGKHIRVAEYYRRVEKKDTLHLLGDGSTMRESDAEDAGMLDMVKENSVQSRDVTMHRIEWYLIAGDQIVEKNVWPGKYIPLVRIVGEEHVIDGVLDRRGHIRSLIDSQRIYNVMNSAAVESVGVQTKVPWLVSAEAIEGYEVQWANCNKKNYSYLPWNSFDDVGQRDIPVPTRTDPPTYPPAYAQGIQQAANDMMAATGQYQSTFGEPSNERSGKAINERERQGNTATFHFISHLSVGIRYTGRILLDLIPKIYDTPRTLKLLGENGDMSTVALDPDMPTAHRDVNGLDDESFSDQQVAMVLNPSVGMYEVEADVGPNYGTRRQETFNAISQILMQNESLTPIIGDIMFRIADFPLADEIAERMKNMVPPQALGKAPDPQMVALQQQLAQQHGIMTTQSQEIAQLKTRDMTQELQKEIDWYKAETDRLKAVGGIDPAALMPVVRQLVSELLGQPVNQYIAAHALENATMVAHAQAITGPQQQPQPQQINLDNPRQQQQP